MVDTLSHAHGILKKRAETCSFLSKAPTYSDYHRTYANKKNCISTLHRDATPEQGGQAAARQEPVAFLLAPCPPLRCDGSPALLKIKGGWPRRQAPPPAYYMTLWLVPPVYMYMCVDVCACVHVCVCVCVYVTCVCMCVCVC